MINSAYNSNKEKILEEAGGEKPCGRPKVRKTA